MLEYAFHSNYMAVPCIVYEISVEKHDFSYSLPFDASVRGSLSEETRMVCLHDCTYSLRIR